MLHGTAVAILLRWNWERWTADPETIPGSPIADQSNGLKRGVPSPPQSGWRVASEEMPGAEMVHTFVATMRAARSRAIASWSDAILFGRVAGCRGADLPRLIEEPAEPRTQKRQGPPIRAGHEHPAEGRGNSCDLTIQSFP